MKKLLSLLALVIIMVSCGSTSGQKPVQIAAAKSSREVPFRAKYTWISTTTFDRYVSENVEIVYVDSAFRANDTVRIALKEYILQERVK